MQDPIIIDDDEPSIGYSGAWVLQNWSPEFNGTMHGTNKAGSTATLRFVGISVAVYGPVGIEATYGIPITTYTLDSEPAVTFTAPTVTNTPLTNQLFYSSGELSPTVAHTLVIEFQNKDKATFWLDYIQVLPQVIASASQEPTATGLRSLPTHALPSSPSSQSAALQTANNAASAASSPVIQSPSPTLQAGSATTDTSSAGITSSSAGTPTLADSQALAMPTAGGQTLQFTSSGPTIVVGQSVTLSAAPASPSSPSATEPAPQKHGGSSGAIAGAVIGALLFLVCLGLLVMYHWRRRRHREIHHLVAELQYSTGAGPAQSGKRSTPAVYEPASTPNSSTAFLASPSSAISASQDGFSESATSVRASGGFATTPYIAANSVSSEDNERDIKAAPRRNARPRRQVDSGVRLAGGPPGTTGDDLHDLPPAYSDLVSA